MTQFDQDFWRRHWESYDARAHRHEAPNPYLVELTRELTPGSALDAGCGTGTEALWLAGQGWQVTGADISAEALQVARARAEGDPGSDRVTWVEADLTTWAPRTAYELVVTHYAHPTIPQLAFYAQLAGWVAPGGTLLVVAHRHGHGHHPDEATVTAGDVRAQLEQDGWVVDVAEEVTRAVHGHGELQDVVVRARRATR